MRAILRLDPPDGERAPDELEDAMQGWMLLRPLEDPARFKGKRIDRDVARRAWQLARPYRGKLILFGAMIVLAAGAQALVPQLVRVVIDTAIPEGDRSLLNWLFLGMLAIGVGTAVISMYERWLSATIGEGLILDLRTLLFRHVQSMPISFFTRTQTGALITSSTTTWSEPSGR